MLPILVLQAVVASASAAVLTLQLPTPLDILFGDRPWKHYPEPHPAPDKSIYDTLTNDGRFTYLTKAINFVGSDIIDVLNGTHEITFFAVPDNAFHRRHSHEEDYRHIFDVALSTSEFSHGDVASVFGDSTPDLAGVISAIDLVDDCVVDEDEDPEEPKEPEDPEEPSDPRKERRKKLIRFLINAILQYHALPSKYDVKSLQYNTTYPTHLKISAAYGGQFQRIRVSHRFKKWRFETVLNGFSKIVVPNVEASNGLIHVVDHPIIPPASIFQELYQFQRFFSIFTSALQRTGLSHDVDLRYVRDNKSEETGHFEGASAVTVFAVPNRLFDRLPKRLQWFLFSPFGTPALRKLLEYHIVPGVIAHSDYFFNQTAEANSLDLVKRCTCGEHTLLKKHPHTEPISSTHILLNTRLHNHTLLWEVERTKVSFPKHPRWPIRYESIVKVNGHKVKIADFVATNGALHVIDKILVPWHCPHGHPHVYPADENDVIWQNWEEWLPQLAAADDAA